jgi:hypothetical protein
MNMTRLVVSALSLAVGAALAAQTPETKPPAAEKPDAKAAAEAMLKSAEAVQLQVEELRGYKFKSPVAKSVYTKDQLRDYIGAQMKKEYGGGKIERTEAWLKCLDLLPAAMDLTKTMTDVLLSQIGGFYDPDKQAFFMMAEASAFGDAINQMMIAHELCHALDDQYVDLRKLMKPAGRVPTEDESYVIGGVAEGSATALMNAWMAKARKDGVDLGDMSKMASQQMDQMKVLIEAPPYCTLLAANYMVGQHFITKGKSMEAMGGKDTGAAINDAAKAMPRSTEQLLHPEKYWNEQKRDEPVVLKNHDEVAALIGSVGGSKVIEQNTLGEMVTALVAGPQKRSLNMVAMAQAKYWTNKAATGWGGDRLFLVGKAGGTEGKPVEGAGVYWVTAWDTKEDCEEFVTAVRKYREENQGFDVLADGRVAVFAFGDVRPFAGKFGEALMALLAFEQDGKVWAR